MGVLNINLKRLWFALVWKTVYIMKTTLLGSAPTLDGIKSVIAKFYYSEKELLSASDNEWQIIGKNGVLNDMRVILKKGRYRFESIDD